MAVKNKDTKNLVRKAHVTPEAIAAGNRLRHWRMENRYTMEQIADAITDRGHHTPLSTYRNWELGHTPAMPVFIILRKLGLDLNMYLSGIPCKER